MRHSTSEEAIRAQLRELTKETRRLHEELRAMLRKDEEAGASDGSERQRITRLFGTVEYDRSYDCKKQRRRR